MTWGVQWKDARIIKKEQYIKIKESSNQFSVITLQIRDRCQIRRYRKKGGGHSIELEFKEQEQQADRDDKQKNSVQE